MAGARRGARGAQPPLLGRDRRPPAAVAHGDRLRAARGARAPRAPRSSSPQAPPWQAARALHLQPHLQPRLHPAPQATPPASQPTEAARARRSASHASIRCRRLHAQWRRRECLPSAPLVNTSSVRLRLARGQWPARTRLRGLVVAREWRCIMWVALWAASSRRDAATTLGWVQCSPGEKNYVLGRIAIGVLYVRAQLLLRTCAAGNHGDGRRLPRRAAPARGAIRAPRAAARRGRRRGGVAAGEGGAVRMRACGGSRRSAAARAPLLRRSCACYVCIQQVPLSGRRVQRAEGLSEGGAGRGSQPRLAQQGRPACPCAPAQRLAGPSRARGTPCGVVWHLSGAWGAIVPSARCEGRAAHQITQGTDALPCLSA